MRSRSMDCLFCKIANGEIPAKIIYRDDLIIILMILPASACHKLIVPNSAYRDPDDYMRGRWSVGHMVHFCAMLAKELGIAEEGFELY